jgi:hypothetical protein
MSAPSAHGYQTKPQPPDDWDPIDLDPYLDGTYTPPVPTICHRSDAHGMFYPGRVNGLHGPSEGGKSWIALFAVAEELDHGHEVIYADYEDHAGGIIQRLLALGARPANIRKLFTYLNPSTPFTEARRTRYELIARRASLVVIDASTEALAAEKLKSNDDTAVAEFNTRLPRWFAKLGPAVILIDHVPKDPDNRNNGQTGSQHKRAAIDGASYLVESINPLARSDPDGRSRIRVSKDRLGYIREHAASAKEGQLQWYGDFTLDATDPDAVRAVIWPPISTPTDDDDDRPLEMMTKIADVLTKAARPLSKNDILAMVVGKTTTIRRAIVYLVNEGYVVVEKGPRNAELHRLVREFEW